MWDAAMDTLERKAKQTLYTWDMECMSFLTEASPQNHMPS